MESVMLGLAREPAHGAGPLPKDSALTPMTHPERELGKPGLPRPLLGEIVIMIVVVVVHQVIHLAGGNKIRVRAPSPGQEGLHPAKPIRDLAGIS